MVQLWCQLPSSLRMMMTRKTLHFYTLIYIYIKQTLAHTLKRSFFFLFSFSFFFLLNILNFVLSVNIYIYITSNALSPLEMTLGAIGIVVLIGLSCICCYFCYRCCVKQNKLSDEDGAEVYDGGRGSNLPQSGMKSKKGGEVEML
jgi:hypothetical protein